MHSKNFFGVRSLSRVCNFDSDRQDFFFGSANGRGILSSCVGHAQAQSLVSNSCCLILSDLHILYFASFSVVLAYSPHLCDTYIVILSTRVYPFNISYVSSFLIATFIVVILIDKFSFYWFFFYCYCLLDSVLKFTFDLNCYITNDHHLFV